MRGFVFRYSARPPAPVLLAALAALMGATAAFVMSTFQVGLVSGLVSAAAAFLAYSVPATLFDWPRVTMDDIVDLARSLYRGIVGLFA